MEAAIAKLADRIETLVSRVEGVERKLTAGVCSGAAAPAAAAPACAGEVSASQSEFLALLDAHIKPLLESSKKISAVLGEQLTLFIAAVEEESRFIGAASRSKKPTMDVLQKALASLSKKIGDVAAYKDKHGRDPAFNNIAAVAEGVVALGWIAVEPTPVPHLNEVIPSSEFYSNRILMANKGKDEVQMTWAKEFNSFLRNLQAYVKKFHMTGLTYSPQGGDLLANLSGAAAAPAAAAPAAAPAAAKPAFVAKPAPAGGNMFADLNKGGAVTSGLKKVTDDMKAKNRVGEAVVAPKPKAAPAPKAASTAVVKPPKMEQQGTKWTIEWQDGANITVEKDKIDMTHAFYIGKCKNSTITLEGKVNSVTIDGCTRTTVIVDSTLASIDIINCTRQKLRVNGLALTVAVDKSTEVEVALSAEAAEKTSIYLSNFTSTNIVLPGKTADADPIECAVPEQFRVTAKDGKIAVEVAPAGGF